MKVIKYKETRNPRETQVIGSAVEYEKVFKCHYEGRTLRTDKTSLSQIPSISTLSSQNSDQIYPVSEYYSMLIVKLKECTTMF